MFLLDENVKLANSDEAGDFFIALNMIYLKQLFEGNVSAFKALVNYCQNPSSTIPDETLKVIEYYHLCQNKTIPDLVKETILSKIFKEHFS